MIAGTPEEWRLFVTFLAQTGLRIGRGARAPVAAYRPRQAAGARPSALLQGQLRCAEVRRYGRRDVPLSPAVAQALWTLKAGHGDDALVFTTRTGRMIDAHNLRNWMRKPAAADKPGVCPTPAETAHVGPRAGGPASSTRCATRANRAVRGRAEREQSRCGSATTRHSFTLGHVRPRPLGRPALLAFHGQRVGNKSQPKRRETRTPSKR